MRWPRREAGEPHPGCRPASLCYERILKFFDDLRHFWHFCLFILSFWLSLNLRFSCAAQLAAAYCMVKSTHILLFVDLHYRMPEAGKNGNEP